MNAINYMKDWTGGYAKWCAVLVLGGASIIGMAWSITSRRAILDHTEPEPVGPAIVEPGDRPEGEAESASLGGVAHGKININAASEAQLELLPGIGPTLAARIIDDRESNGLFESIDDLDRVRGIGPRTIEDLRPMATVAEGED